MLSNGRPTNKSELKIRVRPDCKWKIFWTTKIFSTYNHNNIPPPSNLYHLLRDGKIRRFILQDKYNVFRVSVRSRFREAEAAWCRAARPASGGWGLNKLPTCYLTGGQLTRANWKFASARISSGKYFGLPKIFSAYNHNNIPHEVSHDDIFVLQLVPCGGRDICTSRKLSPPQVTKQKLPRQRKKSFL